MPPLFFAAAVGLRESPFAAPKSDHLVMVEAISPRPRNNYASITEVRGA